MSEYSDIQCSNHEAANALNGYLAAQLNEQEERPEISFRPVGNTLRVTYNDVGEKERLGWDMQLTGFRDAFELCQPIYVVREKGN